MFSITIELLEWSKVLVPRLGVCRENSLFAFVWDTAAVAVSECPVDAMEANESLVEQQVHLAFFVELGGDVRRDNVLVPRFLPCPTLSTSVTDRFDHG